MIFFAKSSYLNFSRGIRNMETEITMLALMLNFVNAWTEDILEIYVLVTLYDFYIKHK